MGPLLKIAAGGRHADGPPARHEARQPVETQAGKFHRAGVVSTIAAESVFNGGGLVSTATT
jgi:hypothetical protein